MALSLDHPLISAVEAAPVVEAGAAPVVAVEVAPVVAVEVETEVAGTDGPW